MHGLYKENLVDHYQNPRNQGTLAHPDFSSHVYNPSCGDVVSFQGTLQGNVIHILMFQGKGCVISQAVASLLTEKVAGYTLKKATELDADFIRSLIGMNLGPTRLKCALLPLEALQNGLKKISH